MTAIAAETQSVRPAEAELRKVTLAAFVGTALEWYDFFLFGMTAVLVFAPLYFASDQPVVSTIQSFLAFAVGPLARPLGGILWGHVGDRYGRRPALIGTVMLMGVATTLIGLLPTYASIGVAAPIMLVALRALQGVAAAGEWGGATLLVVENAAPERRGFYGAILNMSIPVGTVMASGAVALLGGLPREDFLSWGWRIPYLASIVLIGLSIWLRWRIAETPTFQALVATKDTEHAPIRELLKFSWLRVLTGAALYFYSASGFLIFTTFMISYATQTLGLHPSVILTALTAAPVAQFISTYISARLANRIGVAPTVIIGFAMATVLAFPLFWVVDTRDPGLIIGGYIVYFALVTIAYGPLGVLLTQIFPPHLRYSGFAISVNFSALVGGFAPAVATLALAASNNQSWGPALLLFLVTLVSLIGSIAAYRLVLPERG